MTHQAGTFAAGDEVQSARFGVGRVEVDKGYTAIVRFHHGLEECEKIELTRQWTPYQALSLPDWHAPLEVIVRTQAEAIQSVNNAWGVFSRSQIALLPHQLWVCRRVLAQWPTRWLVADDVGLGKTIEAGLILWPLLARGTVKRLLVLCPASLVEQWQYRLREMFDIRLTRYIPEADTPRADFWNTHYQVVASLQTLRTDHKGRQDRLLQSSPWDLLIVDEAHHLNADEQTGPTLGYKLVERLVDERRLTSMVFFTGTPHRGKDYGFWSLLRLLRSDLFNPRWPSSEQLPRLRDTMIRNNKQNVTDLHGRHLFQPPIVTSETYEYSAAEARFYQMLTEFILTGKAYASGLSAHDRRMVILVLIAMQKLASSSVAAIRRALKNRLTAISEGRRRLDQRTMERDIARQRLLRDYEDMEETDSFDELSQKEEDEIAQLQVQLMGDEEPRLKELIAVADEVGEETKIRKIMDLVESRFRDRAVLLFTEYKATQSLVMSALIQCFGEGSVTFINGDGYAEGVLDATRRPHKVAESRDTAAKRFNSGQVRFMVSTEAGGEGIDLQGQCHTLIHVDLPWNPMRLHQRVGRVNRYGQPCQVEVVSLRNPETVEALIWEKLDEKLDAIMRAFGHAMEDPEDLKQLVLGMTSPSLFRELFADASSQRRESLATWFDQKTARFGGKDAIQAVRELVGHSARFDFDRVSPQIPQVDLPDLLTFLRSSLALNGRKLQEDQGVLAFKTPDAWSQDPGIRSSYEGLVFDRLYRGDEGHVVLGVGHPAVNAALHWAERRESCVCTVPPAVLKRPLFVFRITDNVTTSGGIMGSVLVGVQPDENGRMFPLRDWELLLRLNALAEGRGYRRAKSSPRPEDTAIRTSLESAHRFAEANVPSLDLPFHVPRVTALAVLWPFEISGFETSGVTEADYVTP
ncbi:MAG: DEAD/DEAH box helicase [Bacillota bacterium]|nr:DEAD/DEAH box helicase [Bacillota bacterium]